MYDKPNHFPEHVWEDLTLAERKCVERGEHDWYYDMCTMCGARKRVPDHVSRQHDEESRMLDEKEKLAGR